MSGGYHHTRQKIIKWFWQLFEPPTEKLANSVLTIGIY
jgi:hypothetical protein